MKLPRVLRMHTDDFRDFRVFSRIFIFFRDFGYFSRFSRFVRVLAGGRSEGGGGFLTPVTLVHKENDP